MNSTVNSTGEQYANSKKFSGNFFFFEKSNKNETKFWNIEIFKNKIFDVKKNDLTCGN